MKYDKATWRPISTNFRRGRTRGERRVRAFVCHSQEGDGALFQLFNRPSRRASTHFWISKSGAVEQYVDSDDTAWGNGARDRFGGPDARIPWLAAAYASASVNDVTISCELEGRAGEPITGVQEAAALALLRWAHEAHDLGPARRHVTVVEHNQISATLCPSNRWPIDRLLAVLESAPLPTSASILAFWYPGLVYDAALARFINETIVNGLDRTDPTPVGANRNPPSSPSLATPTFEDDAMVNEGSSASSAYPLRLRRGSSRSGGEV